MYNKEIGVRRAVKTEEREAAGEENKEGTWTETTEDWRRATSRASREVRESAHWNRDVYRSSRRKSLLNFLLPMNPSSTQNAVGGSVARMSGEFISVGEALKLVPPFKGNKQEVLAFIGNVDTTFAVINPEQQAILYKYVLTRISGEPRTAISHMNFDSWLELKEFLQNSYIE